MPFSITPPSFLVLSDFIKTKSHLVSFELLLNGSPYHFEHTHLFTMKQDHSGLPGLPTTEENSTPQSSLLRLPSLTSARGLISEELALQEHI